MKKYLLFCAAILAVSGCSNSSTEMDFPVKPQELKDCKIFRLNNEDGAHITVARCPNSTTSTTFPSGKTQATSIVVDGVEYERKEG